MGYALREGMCGAKQTAASIDLKTAELAEDSSIENGLAAGEGFGPSRIMGPHSGHVIPNLVYARMTNSSEIKEYHQ